METYSMPVWKQECEADPQRSRAYFMDNIETTIKGFESIAILQNRIGMAWLSLVMTLAMPVLLAYGFSKADG